MVSAHSPGEPGGAAGQDGVTVGDGGDALPRRGGKIGNAVAGSPPSRATAPAVIAAAIGCSDADSTAPA